jgi:uncharacterized repeat protein (TIGR03803 family)
LKHRGALLLATVGALSSLAAHASDLPISILHSFEVAERSPAGSVVSDGRGNLYGVTGLGGPADAGTLYTVRADGTGFERLHSFSGGPTDGFDPMAGLLLDASGTLYGTTSAGGTSDKGVIFTIRMDGSGFRVIHSFAGGANDGGSPHAALVLDGSGELYGTTSEGGPSNGGTIFRIATDGSGFQLLHAFAGGMGDGRDPQAALLLDTSGNLYGTTLFGGQASLFGVGSDGFGTVFTIRTGGTGFRVLHAFAGGATDGAGATGSVVSDGAGSLYGATTSGGSASLGSVFKIGIDGSGFRILHSFTGGGSDGRTPLGSLVRDGSGFLYGTTLGPSLQTIFRIRTDATGYQLVRIFTDPHDGSTPIGALILDGSTTLYGAMAGGGASNGGTIFTARTDGGAFEVVHAFAGFANDGELPSASLIADGAGNLYGTAASGGVANLGVVFRIRLDGTGFQILHPFTGGASDGSGPSGSLVLDGAGNLYGTTSVGGPTGSGTIFRLKTDGTGFHLLHAFDEEGLNPVSGLILDGAGNLYGTTEGGGPLGLGTVFKVKTDGSGFQVLHAFAHLSGSASATEGQAPLGSLVLDGSGNLYGTTSGGGSSDLGTVFKVKADGTAFQVLHSFASHPDDGSGPHAALTLDGSGNLYGTTSGGGALGRGTVFRLTAAGAGFRLLHSFAGGEMDGSSPFASLILDALGNLYGTTYSGGSSNAGAAFALKTDGTAFRILHSFGDELADGRFPRASLLAGGAGVLVGTTAYGGAGSLGSVFTLFLGQTHPIVTPGSFGPVRKH